MTKKENRGTNVYSFQCAFAQRYVLRPKTNISSSLFTYIPHSLDRSSLVLFMVTKTTGPINGQVYDDPWRLWCKRAPHSIHTNQTM